MDPSPAFGPGLTLLQLQIAESSLDSRLFVSGPAGTGKTTAGVARLTYLLAQGVPSESILLLTPQRTLQEPYLDLLVSPTRVAGGEVTPATMGGLANRMCQLFWPLVSEQAGFAFPDRPPIFLNLETSQYYMAHLVRPLLDQGYFESVTIDRNRLYSQIIDNLNKSASVGFPYTEIAERLDLAYYGDPAQRRVYADAQDCAIRFREYCLAHNLLDYSLQLEIFTNLLWPQSQVRDYLVRSFRHLIYDNVEEDGARAHDVMREWIGDFESAVLLFDEGAGYRRFLGADADTGWALRELCDEHLQLLESFVVSEPVAHVGESLTEALEPESPLSFFPLPSEDEATDDTEPVKIISSHFYPQLLELIADETRSLISEHGIPPSEIVIVSPYLSDALRFSMMNRLEARGIPTRSHRPSRSLHDEPASHTLITLASIAHPHWNIHPPRFDVAYALMNSIEGLDLVRAQLLTDIVYHARDLRLSTFDEIMPEVQERITYVYGERYALLRDWLLQYRESMPLPLDHFFRKLFGEVLSQPGFGYHANYDPIRVASTLIESVKMFRMAMEPSIVNMDRPDFDLGYEYVSMLQEGVIAASYLEGWRTKDKDAVLVAPAYTFLLMNRPVTVQFWLDVASSAWHERLVQPLTHPHVLSRGWPRDKVWTDADEVEANREGMTRVVTGLLRRCKKRIYLGLSELGESGFEQRGDLLRAFQRVLQPDNDSG